MERWNGLSWLNVVVFDAKLGTGERQVALALGPTDDEYKESVLCVGDGGLWFPTGMIYFLKYDIIKIDIYLLKECKLT